MIKRIVEACTAAGLKPPVTLNLGKQKAEAKSAEIYMRFIEAYLKSAEKK